MDIKQLKHFESICVKEVIDPVSTKPHILPIYATASYVMEDSQQGIDIFSGKRDGHIYSRYGNPTIEAAAHKLAILESFGQDTMAKCYLTSTGMSAIYTAVASQLSSGDKLVTQGNLYGGTTEMMTKLLKKLGIETIFTDLADVQNIESVISKNPEVKMIFLETPTNPTLSCLDIEAITSICKSKNILSVIDNTFCTPFIQRPFNYGVDIVIHSTTKYLNGHGNAISGAILSHNMDINQKIWEFLKLAGGTSNAFDAWLLHNGMKTLVLRMKQHCNNALALATFLEQHKAVVQVNYPGLENHPTHSIAKKQMSLFGGMLSFELKGGIASGIKFMDRLKHCTMAPTLGDVDTLILHPASSSHLKVEKEMRLRNGITDGLIRVSVGIENFDDIKEDISQALEH